MSNPNELTRKIRDLQREWEKRLGKGGEFWDGYTSFAKEITRALQDQKHHPMSSQDNPSSGGVEHQPAFLPEWENDTNAFNKHLPPIEDRCSYCGGYGDVAGGRARCHECGGTGIKGGSDGD